MANRDLKSALQVVDLGTLALSGTTPGATALVDTRGFDSCMFLVLTNTVTDAGTAAGFAVEIQESDATAAAGFTAVADAELSDAESTLTVVDDAADNIVVGAINYLGNARYARAVFTGTTGTAAGVRVLAVLGHASRQPATFVGTSVAAT